MGVIRKNDPKLGIFNSSEESLNIPDASDDERTVSDVEASIPQSRHGQRRIRTRLPSVPMSFTNQRKRVGKKRSRRYDNVTHLMTLVEDEELGEVSIYDLIPRSNDAFQKILEDGDSLEAWNNFIQSSEEVQALLISGKRLRETKNIIYNTDAPLTGEQAFRNIKTGLRNILKKNKVPLGMLEYLESQLVEFFSNMPDGTYVSSSSLTSYERLLLHAVSQYHSLISKSFDNEKENARLVKVVNPYELYQSPEVLLGKFLEEKRKLSSTH